MSRDGPLRSKVDPSIAVDPAEVAQVVQEIFAEALGVWVYGSFADGGARKDSDIDIAILPERPIEVDWDYFDRVGELVSRLGREVDLVDLHRVPPLLRFEVFQGGVRVAARDHVACDFYETAAVSGYRRLNEERRELLQEIGRRGTVYGRTRCSSARPTPSNAASDGSAKSTWATSTSSRAASPARTRSC
jgi:uncharacterized protein